MSGGGYLFNNRLVTGSSPVGPTTPNTVSDDNT